MDDYALNILNNKVKEVSKNGQFYVSDFLDLETLGYVKNLETYYPDLNFSYEGGILNAERQKVLIYHDFKPVNKIAVLKITYLDKFKEITHRHVLGTLMSLGIKREKVGDILVLNGESYVAVSEELKDYLLDNLKMINHLSLEVSETKEPVYMADSGLAKTIFVTSLRVDALISGAFNLAREKALNLISREMVKINQKIVLKACENVKACAIISVAHFGRIKLIDASKTTKSGRIVVDLKIYR